jgi:hypothetical protein
VNKLKILNTSLAWRSGLFALVLIRIGMWWLFQHNTPLMKDHYQWQFYYGGDETLFFNRAQELITGQFALLAGGKLVPSTTGVGLPFMMAGLMLFTGKMAYDAILPFLVIGNGLLFAVVSIPVMASWAKLLTGSRLQGFAVGLLWTLLPYLLWLGFAIHPQAEILRNAYVSRQMWVSGVTDSPSMFFVTLGMLLVLYSARAQTGSAWRKWLPLMAGGVSIGFACAIRIHVAPVVLLMIGAMLFARRWRETALAIATMLVGFLPQLWHNQRVNGCFLDQPYINGWLHFQSDCRVWLDTTSMPFSLGHFVENILGLVTRLPLLSVAGAVALLLAVVAFVRCWQQLGGESAIIMFGGPAASFALHVVTFVYILDPIRFTLPAVSFGLPLIVWMVALAISEINRLRHMQAVRVGKVSGL